MAFGIAIVGLWAKLTVWIKNAAAALLIYLGISTVTFTALDAGIGALQANVQSTMGGLPAFVLQMMCIVRIDDAMAIVLSAVVVKMSLVGGARFKVRGFIG